MRGPAMLAWASLIVYGAVAISGAFYSIGALPGWLQGIGQASPIYWLVLGLVLAPMALRRMAGRQSGSQVAAARDRVIAKGY